MLTRSSPWRRTPLCCLPANAGTTRLRHEGELGDLHESWESCFAAAAAACCCCKKWKEAGDAIWAPS